MQIPLVPTEWQQLSKKWLFSIGAAILAVIYLYKTQPPLIFKVVASFLSLFYLLILIALIFPRTSNLIFGKKLYWKPFFVPTPEEGEAELEQLSKELSGTGKRYLGYYFLIIAVLTVFWVFFGLVWFAARR